MTNISWSKEFKNLNGNTDEIGNYAFYYLSEQTLKIIIIKTNQLNGLFLFFKRSTNN